MEKAIIWIKENWTAIVAIAGAAYILFDTFVRYALPEPKQKEVRAKENAVKQFIGKAHSAVRIFFTATRK